MDGAKLDGDFKKQKSHIKVWEANVARAIAYLSSLGQVVSLAVHFFPCKRSVRWPVHSLSAKFLLEPHLLPILLYGIPYFCMGLPF